MSGKKVLNLMFFFNLKTVLNILCSWQKLDNGKID